jgi:hypothetical protein
LKIKLRCVLCKGDADGDGNPNVTSNELADRGGEDVPMFRQSESCMIGLDVVGDRGAADGALDVVLGYPSALASGAATFRCVDARDASSCFDLFAHRTLEGELSGTRLSSRHIANLFLAPPAWPVNATDRYGEAFNASDTPLSWAVDRNPRTSLDRPDLVFTLRALSQLKAALLLRLGFGTDTYVDDVWKFNIAAYCGSSQVCSLFFFFERKIDCYENKRNHLKFKLSFFIGRWYWRGFSSSIGCFE